MKRVFPAIAPSIYVVDDAPHLTELYAALLGMTGYNVRAFNDRAHALAAMNADTNKPDLLITDYRGASMAIDRFLDRCIAVHPGLRILMASGFGEIDMRLSGTRPDRFLQKPFTADELHREVEIALAG